MNAAEREARIGELWRARPRSRLLRLTAVIALAAVVYSIVAPDIAWADLVSARRRANLERFVEKDLLPYPLREAGFSWSGFGEWAADVFAARGQEALAATLWISVAAIALAALVALILAPFGSHTIANARPFAADGDRKWTGPWRTVVGATRLACVLLRAVPEYVWAFLLLAILGPNAWPAVLALAIHNAGILGRLGSETIENLEAAPLESVAAIGAGRRQLALLVALPLALPRFLLYFFYRFETCVREATVLGMLGVVSLGYWIAEARGRQNYDEMVFLVALGAVLVLAIDATSYVARRFIR